MEEQQKLKRQIQNEREKLHHKEQEDKEDYRKKCRELNTQFERLSIREEELSRQNEMLLEERAEVKRRNEKVTILKQFMWYFMNYHLSFLIS